MIYMKKVLADIIKVLNILPNHNHTASCLATSTAANQTTSTVLGFVTIALNQADISDSDYFEVSGNAVVCKKDGYVLVDGSVYMSNNSSTRLQMGSYIYQNDAETCACWQFMNGVSAMATGAKIIQVSAGDKLTLRGRNNSTGTATFYSSNSATYMSVTYLDAVPKYS